VEEENDWKIMRAQKEKPSGQKFASNGLHKTNQKRGVQKVERQMWCEKTAAYYGG